MMISTEFALALARVAGHACAHVDALDGDFSEVPDDARIEQRMQTLGGKAIGHYPDWLPSKAEIRASFIASYCAELGDSLATYRFEQSEDPDNETIAEIVDDLQKALTAAHVELVAAEELADREAVAAIETTREERAAKRAARREAERAADALAVEEDEREFAERAERARISRLAWEALAEELATRNRLQEELAELASSGAQKLVELDGKIEWLNPTGELHSSMIRDLREERAALAKALGATLAKRGDEFAACSEALSLRHVETMRRIRAEERAS